ncbi:MAG TPA: hypothetical protein VGM06_14980 [Polyangiaceae bacterium]|jgi:hypothetical protein
MKRRALLGVLAGGVVGSIVGVEAWAAGPREPRVEVSVIHATKTPGSASVDPQLRDLPQLTRQEPFVRYNVFRLLDRQTLTFDKGKTASCALVDGRTLQVTLVDGSDNKGKKDERYHLRAEIAGVTKKEFLKLLEVTAGADEPFFVGGQSYKTGTLFLELVIRA